MLENVANQKQFPILLNTVDFSLCCSEIMNFIHADLTTRRNTTALPTQILPTPHFQSRTSQPNATTAIQIFLDGTYKKKKTELLVDS